MMKIPKRSLRQPIPLVMWGGEEHEVCETAPNPNNIGKVICRQLGRTFATSATNVAEAADSLATNAHITMTCTGNENAIEQCGGIVVQACDDNNSDATTVTCQ